MKKLILLVIFLFAVWQGYSSYKSRQPDSDRRATAVDAAPAPAKR